MEVVMVLFGIVVLALGLATIYNAHQTKKLKDSADKKEK